MKLSWIIWLLIDEEMKEEREKEDEGKEGGRRAVLMGGRAVEGDMVGGPSFIWRLLVATSRLGLARALLMGKQQQSTRLGDATWPLQSYHGIKGSPSPSHDDSRFFYFFQLNIIHPASHH